MQSLLESQQRDSRWFLRLISRVWTQSLAQMGRVPAPRSSWAGLGWCRLRVCGAQKKLWARAAGALLSEFTWGTFPGVLGRMWAPRDWDRQRCPCRWQTGIVGTGCFSSTFHLQNANISLRNGVGPVNFYPQLQIFSVVSFSQFFCSF